MARSTRIDLAGIPQHVIQRGNNRQACFFSNQDHHFYLDALKSAAEAYACDIHAYVLMTNHVHLLVTPTAVGAVSCMMQSLGRRYVRSIKAAQGRTGTLWEGRFKSNLVDTERYALMCYRYIELNPVRAGVVSTPDEYRWSSFHCNALGEANPVVTPHPCYLALGKTDSTRSRVYQDLFEAQIDTEEVTAIREHVHQGKVLGSDRFQPEIERRLGCPVTLRAVRRPTTVL